MTCVHRSGAAGGVKRPVDLGIQIDGVYEFSAPRYFDFTAEETEEDVRKAEMWFERAKSYAPSPYMMKIRASRFPEVNSLPCNFEDEKQIHELESQESSTKTDAVKLSAEATSQPKPVDNVTDALRNQDEVAAVGNPTKSMANGSPHKGSRLAGSGDTFAESRMPDGTIDSCSGLTILTAGSEASMPNISGCSTNETLPSGSMMRIENNGTMATQKLLTVLPSAQMPTETLDSAKSSNSKSMSDFLLPKVPSTKKTMVMDIAQENQAIKKQKLEGGNTKQIHNVKNRMLLHKSKPDSTKNGELVASTSKCPNEDVEPYVSVAELIKRFESRTRELDLKSSISHVDSASVIRKRLKLTLTRPKEPELQTSHRVRTVRIKSSNELEEEMLANIPKFKARPLNKKILKAPSLPPLPRSAPKPPKFQEFHLKTAERCNQVKAAESFSLSTTDSSCQQQGKALTEAKYPYLETSSSRHPLKAKRSSEQELPELDKFSKFKAKPLNTKIFESKGEPRMSQLKEINFATNERLGSHPMVERLDKLSLYPDHGDKNALQSTIPSLVNLPTEEKGLVKKSTEKLLQEQTNNNGKALIPKMIPKPQPEQCRKPEIYQLESLARHEQDSHNLREPIKNMDKEEGQKRAFKAQLIQEDNHFPVREKERKPLTEVQKIVLHMEQRAENGVLDKNIKEKEVAHKRQREENAKMMEDEKIIKQARKTMASHAKLRFQPQKSSKEATRPHSKKPLVAQREERKRHYMR